MSKRNEMRARLSRYSFHHALELLRVRLELKSGKITDVAHVGVIVTVPCAHMRHKTREVAQYFIVDPDCSQERLDNAIYGTLLRVLAHEAGEGFKRDGVMIRDPHGREYGI